MDINKYNTLLLYASCNHFCCCMQHINECNNEKFSEVFDTSSKRESKSQKQYMARGRLSFFQLYVENTYKVTKSLIRIKETNYF